MQTCYLQLLPQYLVRPAGSRNLRPVVNTPNFSSPAEGKTRFPDRCSPGRSLRNLDLGHVLFPGVLSTRPPGATRHVPISRNVTAVVATSRSTRRPQRKKEPLGWHECAMLVCYTRIAHNLTQATVCCGESAGQFTCVGARVLSISMPRDLRIAWARTKRFMCIGPMYWKEFMCIGLVYWT
jgi:hypothetical protein